MSKDIKSIRVIEFSGRTSDWEGWSEKFLARGKRKDYKKLLLGKERIPTQSEYEKAVTDGNKEQIKIGDLNEEAFEDIVLSINHTSRQGKVAFSLVRNCRTSKYPEGNCKLAWDRLVAKYAPKTAPSLLKLKKEFANSKLDDNDKHPDEWVTELESLRNEMDNIGISGRMSDLDFMIHILNNLPELYDVVLDGMESRLMLPESDMNKLTIENIREKLNNRYERTKRNEYENENENGYEKALSASNYYKKKFKGRCHDCGQIGHKASNCPNDAKKGYGRFGNIKCFYCGKMGHHIKDCPEKRADLETKSEMAKLAKGRNEGNSDESYDELGF